MTKQFDPASHGFIPGFTPTLGSDLIAQINIRKILALQEENARLRKENEKLRKENEQFNNILVDLAVDEEDAFFVPSYPKDFTFYSSKGIGDGLPDDSIQDLIVCAHEAAQELEDGQFTMASTKNVAVIVLREGDKLITVVAEDYYENELEIESDDTEDDD